MTVAGAASANKLDREILVPRGIRWTEPRLIKSGFQKENEQHPIQFAIYTQKNKAIKLVIKTNTDQHKLILSYPDIDFLESQETAVDFVESRVDIII